MSKTRLYDGNLSSSWALHRIVRDLMSIFSPICPFFTHYLSSTLYGTSSVDVREFPALPDGCGSQDFESMQCLTESLVAFNSMVWKKRRVRNLIEGAHIENRSSS